jgi:hypothetical protein
MALDLSKLGLDRHFEFDTVALGRVKCHHLTLDAMYELGKALADQTLGGPELTRLLLAALGKRVPAPATDEPEHAPKEAQKEAGNPLSADDARQLSDAEIENFAKLFLEHHPYLLHSYENAERITTKNEKGEDVISLKPRPIDLPRKPDEKDSDYLARVFRRYVEEDRKRHEKMMKSFVDPFRNLGLSKSALDMVRENALISSRLRETIDPLRNFGLPRSAVDMMRENALVADRLGGSVHATAVPEPMPMPIFRPPRNPILDTNKRLDDILDRVEEMRPLVVQSADLIRSMNDAAIRMIGDFGRNARRAEFYTLLVIFIAAVSLIVTAVFSWLNYEASNAASDDAKRAAQQFMQRIESLSATEDGRITRLIESIQGAADQRGQQDRDAFVQALKDALKEFARKDAAGEPPKAPAGQ